MTGLVYWLDMAGVIVFSLSGVILACRSRMDPFGMLVLAAVTGIGGGTLRDLVLGVRPVFWIADPTYLWVIIATVGLSIVGFHYIHRLSRVFLPVADAFGLALFTVIGAHKALQLEASGVVAVLMGLLTGVAGGMVRDVLAHRVPMVLRQEVYATASIAGGIAYVGLGALGVPAGIAIGLALTLTLGLRLSAIHWRLSLPVFAWVVIPPPADPAPTGGDPGADDSEAERRVARPKARVRMISPRQRSRKDG
ncbi:trimeric intracellular cation channel family protein [Billgrantia diversa]|uniref:trimeric intracellular cation channel family protein n=1 Tax=Halomonas sp. MCCC 1A13316 TaxID=2733487 RepID=UPI0018A6653B|nr:trimeric intracellular cation channel family protein [Halomonas sp. MCCC 1A13316]QOR40060.1 trimeric intracellular cation channel family protein [Halomonas sp. MCCC 1A13316]